MYSSSHPTYRHEQGIKAIHWINKKLRTNLQSIDVQRGTSRKVQLHKGVLPFTLLFVRSLFPVNNEFVVLNMCLSEIKYFLPENSFFQFNFLEIFFPTKYSYRGSPNESDWSAFVYRLDLSDVYVHICVFLRLESETCLWQLICWISSKKM